MTWSPVEGGLKWHYRSDSALMWFEIVHGSPALEAQLAVHEKRPRPYEEWLELWHARGWTRALPQDQGTSLKPTFGTDLPKDRDTSVPELENYKEKTREEKLQIFSRALRAGYRRFDTAQMYGSASLVFEAAKQLGIPTEQIEVVYKIAPETAEGRAGSLDARLRDFRRRLGVALGEIPTTAQRVLMLHEMPEAWEQAKSYLAVLYDEAAAGRLGAVAGVGVSNVSLEQLTRLHEYTAAKGMMRLRFVQNRFTPYDQDTGVRAYCAEQQITYMGFGLFGGAGLGACVQGFGMPQKQLQVLQDARFLALAARCQREPSELLLAWARAKGVTTVIYSGGHAAENIAAQNEVLPSDQVEAIDALFVAAPVAVRSAQASGIQALCAVAREPFAAYVLGLLCADGMVASMLGRLVNNHIEHAKEPEQELGNFVLRLLRFVAHLQILAKSMMVKDWREALVEAFHVVAVAAADLAAVVPRLYKWSQKDYLEIGGALHALPELTALAAPPPATKPAIGSTVQLTDKNASLMDQEDLSPVPMADAKTGVTYFCNITVDKEERFNINVRIIMVSEGVASAQVVSYPA